MSLLAAAQKELNTSGVSDTVRLALQQAARLYSARNSANYEQRRSDGGRAYEYLPTNDEHWRAALNAQRACPHRTTPCSGHGGSVELCARG